MVLEITTPHRGFMYSSIGLSSSESCSYSDEYRYLILVTLWVFIIPSTKGVMLKSPCHNVYRSTVNGIRLLYRKNIYIKNVSI